MYPQLWVLFCVFKLFRGYFCCRAGQAECNHTRVNVCSHLPHALMVTAHEGLVPLVWEASWLSPWFSAALRACSRGLRQGSTLCVPTLPCPRLLLPLRWFWCWLDHSHPHPDTDPCGRAPSRSGVVCVSVNGFTRLTSCFIILLCHKHSIKY